jgi:hypothetical protein
MISKKENKMNIKKIMLNIILLIVMLIVSNQFIYAQENKNDSKISEVVSTLKQKVLLNNDQETQVLTILTQLKKDITTKPENKDALVKAAQTKVENLLDKRQKMKYEILKNDFWKQITG